MLQHSFKKLLGKVAQRRAPGKGTAAYGAWRARRGASSLSVLLTKDRESF